MAIFSDDVGLSVDCFVPDDCSQEKAHRLLSLRSFQTDMFVFQIYYYHNVKCRVEMFDKDVIMLQV